MRSTFIHFILLSNLILSAGGRLSAQVDNVELYGFIHSLVVHDPPLIEVPNHETTTIYWINDIAREASKEFSFTGQFGQLPTHVDLLPPGDHIAFPGIETPWNSYLGQTFGSSEINTIILTAANFIQWDLPTNPDPSDPEGRSAVETTETLFDWTEAEIPGLRYYIYGNWPEMDTRDPFPPTVPTSSEIDEFHETAIGDRGTFDSWWTLYQDAIVSSRPDLNPRLIPVGRIISEIYTQLIPESIAFDELYEDSAPHGRANTYFLAGLISYMALYESPVPVSYEPSEIVHPAIRSHLSEINEYIWQELNDFNFPDGESRVFYSTILDNASIKDGDALNLFPNPVYDHITLHCACSSHFTIRVTTPAGEVLAVHRDMTEGDRLSFSGYSQGVYYLHFMTEEGNREMRRVVKR